MAQAGSAPISDRWIGELKKAMGLTATVLTAKAASVVLPPYLEYKYVSGYGQNEIRLNVTKPEKYKE